MLLVGWGVPSSGLPSSIGNFNVGGAAARSFDGALGGGFSGPAFQTPIADSIVSGASMRRSIWARALMLVPPLGRLTLLVRRAFLYKLPGTVLLVTFRRYRQEMKRLLV